MAAGNLGAGVYVNGFNPGPPVNQEIHDVTVGGSSASSGNVISGNGDNGIFFFGAGVNNKILKNLVGTNAAGSAPIANTGTGAIRTNDDEGLAIGDAQGHGNLISGNASYGLYLFGGHHTVQGNNIGTDLAGTAAIPNANSGIEL